MAWGNKDTANNKPKFPYERQVRTAVRLNVSANTLVTDVSGQTILTFKTGASDVSNAAIVAGMSVFGANTAQINIWPTGVAGYFISNTTVVSVTANTVTLSQNVASNVFTGSTIEFDAPTVLYSHPNDVANTYYSDTILITATRCANANTTIASKIGNLNQGWNKVTQKTNNDGTIRYLKETLVALANSSASNTNSGNTSTGQIVSGL